MKIRRYTSSVSRGAPVVALRFNDERFRFLTEEPTLKSTTYNLQSARIDRSLNLTFRKFYTQILPLSIKYVYQTNSPFLNPSQSHSGSFIPVTSVSFPSRNLFLFSPNITTSPPPPSSPRILEYYLLSSLLSRDGMRTHSQTTTHNAR